VLSGWDTYHGCETQPAIAGYLPGYAAFLITGDRAGDLFVWSFRHSVELCGVRFLLFTGKVERVKAVVPQGAVWAV